MKVEESTNPIFKVMIVASFVMLSMMTWGMSPLQKLVEKVQEKETIKAKLHVCSEIRAMVPVYEEWIANNFKSGCAWELRNWLLVARPKEEEAIRKDFANQEGETFENTMNHCGSGAAEYMREGKMVDRMATPLYFEKLDCPAIYEKAAELGIKEEDLNENKD